MGVCESEGNKKNNFTKIEYNNESIKVDIFVVNHDKKTYLLECPKTISYRNLTKLLKKKEILKLEFYYLIVKGIKFNIYEKNQIFNFKNGDKVIIFKTGSKENVVLHQNPKNPINPSEKVNNDNNISLTGILRLILIKDISFYIKNVNIITNTKLKDIVIELKKGIQIEENAKKGIISNLKDTDDNNILSYSTYINNIIKDKDINYLLSLIQKEEGKNIIFNIKNKLSKFENININFENIVLKAIKDSYFDYSLINISIYENEKLNDYLKAKRKCPNVVTKFLFHGTEIDSIADILTNEFFYAKKAFFGMGIYFTDMLDYVSFYCGGKDINGRRQYYGKVLPINTTFSCVGTEVFYCQNYLKNIFDFSLYVPEFKDFPSYETIKKKYHKQMVPLHYIHFARVETQKGHALNIDKYINNKIEGKFIGTEYVITEKEQILPLYGLTFKRNEYLIIWKDPNFVYENNLREQKLFIYGLAKMNAYFVASTERALELIKKKRFNKIILLSNIGKDSSGIKFVEISRKILGFDIVVLFFSNNLNNLSLIQQFPNALFTNNDSFFRDYILNYNYKGILSLKQKIERYYNIKLNFNKYFFTFPSFINEKNYEEIIFEEPNLYFKKVIIKNSENYCILCIDKDGSISFKKLDYLDINLYEWYVTINGNEITLFSNGYYLGADTQGKIARVNQYMERYFFETSNHYEYSFYYKNKFNILSVNGTNAILSDINNKNINKNNQIFKLIEVLENIYDY